MVAAITIPIMAVAQSVQKTQLLTQACVWQKGHHMRDRRKCIWHFRHVFRLPLISEDDRVNR